MQNEVEFGRFIHDVIEVLVMGDGVQAFIFIFVVYDYELRGEHLTLYLYCIIVYPYFSS